MTNKELAEHTLIQGANFPYDASDKWWLGDGNNPPKAKSWAHAAARGVIADLKDRKGMKNAFSDIDEVTRAVIVEALADIIKLARKVRS